MMGEARTIWHDLQTRPKVTANRQRSGVLLATGLLIAMGVAEALFLSYVVGVDTVDLLTAAQGASNGVE
jgi:hypothetical protein